MAVLLQEGANSSLDELLRSSEAKTVTNNATAGSLGAADSETGATNSPTDSSNSVVFARLKTRVVGGSNHLKKEAAIDTGVVIERLKSAPFACAIALAAFLALVVAGCYLFCPLAGDSGKAPINVPAAVRPTFAPPPRILEPQSRVLPPMTARMLQPINGTDEAQASVTFNIPPSIKQRERALQEQQQHQQQQYFHRQTQRPRDWYQQQQRPASADASAGYGAPPSVTVQGTVVGTVQKPQAPSSSTFAGQAFCPGLIVPEGNECVLAVRTLKGLAMPPSGGYTPFDAMDLWGKKVLRVEVAPPASSSGPNQSVANSWQQPVAVLRHNCSETGSSGLLLAYCLLGQGSAGRRSAYLYNASDEFYAHVVREPDGGYTLTSDRMGIKLLFLGDYEEHDVTVNNELNEQLADAEPYIPNFDPTNIYYKLRVVSHVDVGLVLCGMLAIDHIEAFSRSLPADCTCSPAKGKSTGDV
eukprot:gnl/TRDRNA2_/TRDRNA2_155777_c0_seq1.p1 gnl/TRDRNA2_/TRDRNA2_155777_c0~~gnl/TRDRNA2_/TRDRNA2_155777_c0_seq1.p1  ORF type:complete len:471 (-),score=65.07 gnl/TRDRNA2_/TRDRNA2_155777_c0_seq1:44-1456(-)